MRTKTSTLLILAYGAISLVVILMVGLMGMQYQKTQALLAELNASEREESRKTLEVGERQPRQSMRPALIRLERLLEARTQEISVQQSQLKQQISGREKLQQKYEKLSAAYEQLLAEHQALAKEVEFYLSAVGFAYDSLQQADQDGELVLDDESGLSTLSPLEELAAQAEVDSLDDLDAQVDGVGEDAKRDSLIAGYASHAMIEMGGSAVPLLASILSDDQAEVRAWAVWVLGEIGSDAAVVAPELQLLLGDDEKVVSDAAAEALVKIGTP